MFTCAVLFLALFASAQGRAVNISNTWVLPEEGFPVFYRYFRDRISWYEADAVCQFHHANLVTVDTTAQYDAVRAYLKELDISSAVWVGLIRSNPDGDFTWTDYRGLSGDGYWSASPDARAAPLCAAADPAADYRWEARACGGPTVASFICELPVPQWALGNEGCMVRALPALTILYLPESAAVQLTADCGLAGVKRIQCTGNMKREDLLKDLSCTEEEELSSTLSIATKESSSSSSDLAINSTDLEMTTEDDITTKHESAATTQVTPVTVILKTILAIKQQKIVNKLNNIYEQKNINLDLLHNNNLQSNDIPKLANNENFLTIEQSEKLEDEKHMHHKMLHDELARHGNFETIFTQPTDHFVPPLVMAKAKISDDMTVLSLAEKHAQQLAEQQKSTKHINIFNEHNNLNSSQKSTTEAPSKSLNQSRPLVITLQPVNAKDSIKKDKSKTALPKKYKEKYDDPKAKNFKIDNKLSKFEKSLEKSITPTEITTKLPEVSSSQITETSQITSEDDTLELTVVLKEPKLTNLNQQDDIAKIENIAATKESILTTKKPGTKNTPASTPLVLSDQRTTKTVLTSDSATTDPVTKYESTSKQTVTSQTEIQNSEILTTRSPVQTDAIIQDIALNHEVIKITIVDEKDKTNPTHTVFEVTTLVPQFKDEFNTNNNSAYTTGAPTSNISEPNRYSSNNSTTFSRINAKQNEFLTTTEKIVNPATVHTQTETTLFEGHKYDVTESAFTTQSEITTTTKPHLNETNLNEKHHPESSSTDNILQTTENDKVELLNITEIYEIETERNLTDPDAIDDYNSPLLSAANEPLRRPNRSRRPQPPNRLTKFSPFRILG